MPDALTVSLSSENLASGSAEERVTFGLLAMTANDRLLTAGEDLSCGELRHGPHVAGYPLAEWLVWNWWRQRWEFGRPSDEDATHGWDSSHRMATIGDGYAWPNITISSDGVQAFLASEPSRDPSMVPFRYLGAPGYQAVAAAELETAVDGFVEEILTRLKGQNLRGTNLHRLWHDLKAERKDPEVSRFRRLEAQLGHDPDEADESVIRRGLDDAAALGEEAWGEVAADGALRGRASDQTMSAKHIEGIARGSGFDANTNDVVALTGDDAVPRPGEVEAWRMGEHVAWELRDRQSLDGHPISDRHLADFSGTTSDVISNNNKLSHYISFALDQDGGRTRISLKSRWETGRRFDLARLIGDRVLGSRMGYAAERLFPVTRTRSYRQKMQRAFAAEFLSPFAAVDDMLDGDYSEEKQDEAARYFNVSPMTIRTQLVNHGRIDLDDAPDIAIRGAYL